MSVWLAMLIGAGIGIIITTLILSNTRNGRIKAEYEQYIAELELEHQQALAQAQKRSVNTCLLYTSPSPRDTSVARMPSAA